MWLLQMKRIGASFGSVFLAYWCYALLVVPLIEPSLKRGKSIEVQASQGRSTDPFQHDLKGLFPADAWEMGDAKILRSGQTSLLFQDYQPKEDGTVHIFPCTVVIRPESSEQAPLIMQAPEGAVLRLNRPLDLKSAQFGQPVAGRLQGQIRIHSPGRADGTGQLQILTSNVQITTQRLWTANEVDVQFDKSHARGSDLIIQLLPQQQSKKEREAQGWAGVRSIELVKLDELHIELEPKPQQASSDESTRREPSSSRTVPVKVTCSGPFGIDFQQKVVTFEKQVHLRRLNPNAAEDSLRCERLQMFLVAKAKTSDDKQSAESMPKLDPERVIAEGNPAVLDAPSRMVHVSGRKLMYDLVNRRFRLWADEEDPSDQVLLRFKTHQMLARELDAEMQDEKTLRKLRATGPGIYRGVLPAQSKDSLQASWQGLLSIDQRGNGQLLTMNREASVIIGADNRIDAHQIQLWFDLVPAPSQSKAPLRPKRLLAVAAPNQPVHVSSPELKARTSRLDARFQDQPLAQRQPRSTAAEGDRQAPEPTNGPLDRFQGKARPDRIMDVTSQQIEMLLVVKGKQVNVRQIDLRGESRLVQQQNDPDQTKSLQIAADDMRIRDRDGRGSHVVTAVGQPVDIRTEKFTLQTAKLQLDRAENVLWTDGAGRMTMMMDRDLNNQQPLDVPQEVTLDWQDKMQFDGLLASFHGNVDVRSSQRRLRSTRLVVQLDQRIDFVKSASKQRPGIQKIQADGNVLVEDRELDDSSQVVSVTYLQVPHVRYDHLSGDAYAGGPGQVVTHRRGFRGMQLPGASQAEQTPAVDDAAVTFLQVDFQRQILGNVQRRAAEFQGQVRVVYGPVQSWNESIDPDAALGEKDVLMSCERLAFAEGQLAADRQQTFNMVAQDNTYVEGKTFTARGQRISYEQNKKLLILEGTARSDAVLSHQARVGAPRSETVARKILFWTDTQRVEVDDARYIDLSNLGF